MMDRLPKQTARRTPIRRVALGLCVAGALLLVAFSKRPWSTAFTLWSLANAVLVARAGLWAVFHPMVLVRIRRVLGLTSLLAATGSALLLHREIERFAEHYTDIDLGGGLVFYGWMALSLPVAFPLAVALGATGAAVGGFMARKRPDPTTAARVGVGAFWLTAAAGILIGRAAEAVGGSGDVMSWLLCGTPVLSLWTAPAVRRLESGGLEAQMTAWFLQRCTVRFRFMGRMRTWDARRAACAVAAAFAVGMAGALGLLSRLQASAHLALFAQRRVLEHLNLNLGDTRAPTNRLVILEWDPAAVRKASLESSECAVLADLLQTPAVRGAALAVVGRPELEPKGDNSDWLRGLRRIGTTAVTNNLRDLPRFAAALGMTNVVLAVPAEGSDRISFDRFPDFWDDTGDSESDRTSQTAPCDMRALGVV
jgi:hypothetical protein